MQNLTIARPLGNSILANRFTEPADEFDFALAQPLASWDGLDTAAVREGAAIQRLNIFRPSRRQRHAETRVVSLNLHRRHLNESQRAMIAAKIATTHTGGDRRSEDFIDNMLTLKNEDAGKLMNVSHDSVSRARVIREKGTGELIRAVEDGEISLRPVVTMRGGAA